MRSANVLEVRSTNVLPLPILRKWLSLTTADRLTNRRSGVMGDPRGCRHVNDHLISADARAAQTLRRAISQLHYVGKNKCLYTIAHIRGASTPQKPAGAVVMRD